jgi:hypothetical protein
LEGDLAGRAQRGEIGGIVTGLAWLGVATSAPEVLGGEFGALTGSKAPSYAVTLRTGQVGLLEHGFIEALLSDGTGETVHFGLGETVEVVGAMPICGRVLQ